MPSPAIVLVHGAFGDASSWRPVYDRLAGDGHTVLAPPNPLRGTPYDASFTASIIDQIGRWGAPLMTEPDEQDAYRGNWLAFPISFLVSDRTPDQSPVTIELRFGEDAITVETGDGKVRTHPGAAEKPDLILTGAPQLLVGILTGQLNLTTARARGLQTQGNAKILLRFRPESARAQTRPAEAVPS
jgi:SCP-2 sterol transfer family